MFTRPKDMSEEDAKLLFELFVREAVEWIHVDPISVMPPALLKANGVVGFNAFARLDDETKYYLMMCAFRGSIRGAHLRGAIRNCTKRTRREIQKYVREVRAEGAH